MKQISFIIIAIMCVSITTAQDFKKNIGTAQTSYSSGKLQDAHFALQQMMLDLDITIGKEVLKLFPTSMDSLQAVPKEENVFGNSQFTGVTIEKHYGVNTKKSELNVVINSPLLTTLNAYITSPLMPGFGSDPNTRIVKVNSYKARLSKEGDENGSYRLEIPLTNALLTLKVSNSSESEILAWAGKLPIEKIAGLLQ